MGGGGHRPPGPLPWIHHWTVIFRICSPGWSYSTYNGGQKCWDLSSDITKTSDPSPPTPNKAEFCAKWVKMSAFLATTLLGGVGGLQHEPKAEQKIVVRSRVLPKNYLEGFFHTVPISFVLHCNYEVTPEFKPFTEIDFTWEFLLTICHCHAYYWHTLICWLTVKFCLQPHWSGFSQFWIPSKMSTLGLM